MRRSNKALYESIMRNVSRQLKRVLNENIQQSINESVVYDEEFEKNYRIFKRLVKEFKDDPNINIISPFKKRVDDNVAAIITFSDPNILVRLSQNRYKKEADKLRLQVNNDLTVNLEYIPYGNKTPIPALTSKNIKQLVDKLKTNSFMEQYIPEDNDYNAFKKDIGNDEFYAYIDNIDILPEAETIVNQLNKKFIDLDTRIKSLLTPEFYSEFKFLGEIHMINIVNSDYNSEVPAEIWGSLENVNALYFKQLLTIVIKYNKSFILNICQNYVLDNNDGSNIYEVIDTVYERYMKYISKYYPTEDNHICFIFTNEKRNYKVAIEEFIDIYTKYVEFLEKNFDTIYNEIMNK